jgi:hypothetical protein
MTVNKPTVRASIAVAQDGLLDLMAYVTANQGTLDLTHLQLLASKVLLAIEAAQHELLNATCDAETALARL